MWRLRRATQLRHAFPQHLPCIPRASAPRHCPSATTTPGQPGSGDTSGGVMPARDIVGPGEWGKNKLEEGTLTQELFQQFPLHSSAAKGEPAAACALPAGAGSSPCACPSLEQTPAARSGQRHRQGDFPESVTRPVSMPQLRLCSAFAKRGLCQGNRTLPAVATSPERGTLPAQGKATHGAKPSGT